MSNPTTEEQFEVDRPYAQPKPGRDRYWINRLLFPCRVNIVYGSPTSISKYILPRPKTVVAGSTMEPTLRFKFQRVGIQAFISSNCPNSERNHNIVSSCNLSECGFCNRPSVRNNHSSRRNAAATVLVFLDCNMCNP